MFTDTFYMILVLRKAYYLAHCSRCDPLLV